MNTLALLKATMEAIKIVYFLQATKEYITSQDIVLRDIVFESNSHQRKVIYAHMYC